MTPERWKQIDELPQAALDRGAVERKAFLDEACTAKARKSYQDFLALWKDADADLPILIEAKREYARLK
jgi:hypothetical protein